ncbi:hypothetical protein Rhopal_004218-T1 [Rhodotorula paludigena]|uniref:ATP11-domain-containing protein n=1 Tax=Rhodotorula paludigena TaxID=86838 RepID=A0AAV5GNV2_9BASI|nr:hypothetical protein Rhopal_004218-T1 [Rhodotorula paludigena]
MSLARTRLSSLGRSARSLRAPAPLLRPLSTSALLRNATPDWEELIGGRAGIERKRALFEDKYRAALERKAAQEGLSVDALKERAGEALRREQEQRRRDVMPQRDAAKAAGKESLGPVEAGSVDTRKSADELDKPDVVRPVPSAEGEAKRPLPPKQGESAVKALNDIMDLSKASDLTTSALSQLWTTYHQSKGFLSAAIPMETYLRMINSARKYPIFVLPLAREAELPEGQEAEKATEMHLLEWAILPPPAGVSDPVPPPSTVLFTPLAEYKARQEYSQPYLILTHYTDLAASHDVVLMRGEVSANVALNATDAQVLALFYNDSGKGGEVEARRRDLLRSFHEAPEQFDVEALIRAGEISE